MSDASIWTPGSDIPLVNANTTNVEQRFVATAGQTNFTLTNFAYVVGTNSLKVYVNGARQHVGTNFTETSGNSFTLSVGLEAGETVLAEGIVGSEAAEGAQYWAEQSELSATASATSALAASVSATSSASSANASAASAAAALVSENAAAASESAASASSSLAEEWATKLTDPVAAGNYSAKQYAMNAGVSADAAQDSEAACAAFSSVGFNVSGTNYDFGFITDPSLTFSTDYGSLV